MARGGEIKKVGDLFEVYKKKLYAPEGVVVKEFQNIIKQIFNVTITKEMVSYTPSSKTLSLKLPGQIKTEILLQKEAILSLLKKELGKGAPKDII